MADVFGSSVLSVAKIKMNKIVHWLWYIILNQKDNLKQTKIAVI